MSGARGKRDALAPSLFPFLAVLLCTMGSLVLLLMLIVSGAQASAKQASQALQHRKEELQSITALAKSSYDRQLAEGRVELERKRVVLQHYEEHILELLDELEELKQTAELLAEENSEASVAEKQAELTELERQLAEATRDLEQQQPEKPENKKPIFAIIPYEGKHGTHRRPIYLECTAEGIRIQPENVLLTMEDLAPPHGPGNPLDAALRAIRAEFPPPSGALTRTAYPLLIVRPSGVRSYALARSAMDSWDDQFGYELIDEELELAFPSATPGLDAKIAKAVKLAQERQQAIVMAMPRKYRQQPLGASTQSSGFSGGAAGMPGGISTDRGGLERGGAATQDTWPPSGGERGGFANDLAGAGYDQAGGRQPGQTPGSGTTGFARGDASTYQAGGAATNLAATGDMAANPSLASPAGRSAASSASGSSDGYFGKGSQAGESAPSSPASSQTPQGLSADGGASADRDIAGARSGSAQGGNSAAGASTPQPGASVSVAGPPGSPSEAGASQEGSPVSLDRNFSNQREDARPVASQRGRNWAWSQGPPTETPVVRSLHLHCFTDRWVLLPESGEPEQGLEIPFTDTPRARAEKLASAIRERVDAWGLAIAGGYWRPVLVVDVAPQAAWRFQQLQRLLEGSGIEVRLRGERR